MDVNAIRLVNLRALVAGLTANGRLQKQAAIDLDLSPSYLNQLLGGKKMGDEVARKLEQTRHLDHGWMDREHFSVEENRADGYQLLRIDPATIAAAIRLVRLSFANLDLEYDSEEDGVPLAFAYEYLFQKGERNVTPDNLIDFSKKLAERLRGNDESEARPGNTGSVGGGHRRAS